MVRQYQSIVVTDGPSADEVVDAHYGKMAGKTIVFTGYEIDEPGLPFRFEATILELIEEPGKGPSVFRMTLDVSLKGKYKGVYDANTRQATLMPA